MFGFVLFCVGLMLGVEGVASDLLSAIVCRPLQYGMLKLSRPQFLPAVGSVTATPHAAALHLLHIFASALTLLDRSRQQSIVLSLVPLQQPGANNQFSHAETDETYDDESGSELSLEVGAEAGAEFEAQQRLHAASVAQSGPATAKGEPAAVPPHQSMLRRFSKDHAVSEDIQKRFMIAVENDEKAAKTRVQDWLVQPLSPAPPRPP